jgi:hypothetical protein
MLVGDHGLDAPVEAEAALRLCGRAGGGKESEKRRGKKGRGASERIRSHDHTSLGSLEF